MSLADEHVEPRGDQPVIAAQSVLHDRKELAAIALERTRMPMVVSDPRQPDNPLVMVNSAFLEQTGYAAGEVIGRNCRFLQGPDTDPHAVDQIRSCLSLGKSVDIELLNYRRDGEPFWNRLYVSPIHDERGELLYYFASQIDITESRRTRDLERAEHALLLEVDHRAKNALALVQGIVRMGSRDVDIESYTNSVVGRVDALAIAHTLLSDNKWRGVGVVQLIDALSEAVASAKVKAAGPQILLTADQVQPLAMVLNELLSNVVAHGSLRSPEGECHVNRRLRDNQLLIEISEDGGDATLPPSRSGLGSRIVDQVVQRQLRGSISSSWRAGNLQTRLTVPLQS